MASSTAPDHDFAPAWLKIPSNSQKQSNSTNSEPSQTPSSLSSKINLKNISEPKRERGRSGFPYRHHSIDADDLQRQLPTHSSNGSDYNLVSGFKHSGSQPSLGRRSNSRQDFRDSSFNSKGSSSFDFGEPHRPSNSHWGRQRSFERSHGGNLTNNSRVDNAQSDLSPNWTDKKTFNKFDQDFPSLKGDSNDANVASPSPSTKTSVWDMSKSGKFHLSSSSVSKKIQLVQKPINESSFRNSSPNGTNGNTSPKCASTTPSVKQPLKISSASNLTSVYRTFVPPKGLRRTVNDSSKVNGQTGNSSSSQTNATPQLEKLNTRLVTHPKSVSNKSEFLKELRDDNSIHYTDEKSAWDDDEDSRNVEKVDVFDKPLTNGVEKIEISEEKVESSDVNCIDIPASKNGEMDEHSVLSRSLEDEQRLLRMMGWKEEDSEDESTYAPLTEDEVKEFKNLPKHLPKRCNELPRNYQFTWSPKRVLPVPYEPENDNSISSTSDSDSD